MDPNSPEAMAKALDPTGLIGPTAEPGQPNVLDYAKQLLPGTGHGIYGMMQTAGQQTPNWMGTVDKAINNEPVNTALGIFAGPASKTADLDKLAEAQRLVGKTTPKSIFDRTNWFQGKDEQWRYPISDVNAKLIRGPGQTVADKLEHPALFDAYPNTEGMLIDYNQPEGKVNYDPFGDTINAPPEMLRGLGDIGYPQAKSMLFHELQHGVQEREGFARGGTSKTFYNYLRQAYPKIPIGDIQKMSEDLYMRLSGETEARLAERLAVRPPEYSQGVYPPTLEDITRRQQIVGPGVGQKLNFPSQQDYITALRSSNYSPRRGSLVELPKGP